MEMIKCKMCGGDMTLSADQRCGTCEYCGSTMTLPRIDDEQRAAAFNRGNHFRRIGEFDKALAVYERIVQEDETDAEAHWCCALCRFGIEYVKDASTGEYLPTCHRASFDSFLEDVDYKAALEHADGVARAQYQKDGEKIAEVQRGILAISQKEQPFDVFLCYKETDDRGQRTVDSTLAQDIYYQLTGQGRRVFFARITLEDKAGVEYEPYIFAALHSARVMVVVGTKPEYLNAAWVKNEWSRYLALMKQDRKRLLIPCYRDMDPYDLPEQLSILQSYDMGKIGFIQDLIRGIDKILSANEPQAQPAAPAPAAAGGPTADSLLKRGQIFLADSDWGSATEYFDKVLDMNPECAEAYIGKLCAAREYRQIAELAKDTRAFSDEISKLWKWALDFASPELRATLEDYRAASENLLQEKLRKCEETKSRLASIRNSVQGLLVVSNWNTTGLHADGSVSMVDEDEDGVCDVSDWKYIVAINTEGYHTVGLRADGTVVAVGDNENGECNVSDWRDIVAIDAVFDRTVGLKVDGTVVVTGDNEYGECNVSDWRDITAIGLGYTYTIGLKADGTVVVAGEISCGEYDVSGWRNVVAIAAGDFHAVGLKADGTVVAVGRNDCGECDVSGWRDVAAIYAEEDRTMGLKADGTVVATGKNEYGECNVSNWRDIVAICMRAEHTVGLKADGTVVAVGKKEGGRCNVSNWRDIVAIGAGEEHTVGLKADGTVVAVGCNEEGECNVSDWRLFDSVETLAEERENLRRRGEELRKARKEADEEQARKEAEERRRQIEARRAELNTERAALQAELPNLRGLFSGGKRRQVEARLAEIEAELKKL